MRRPNNCSQSSSLELVSKELNHFGFIVDLFRHIWVYTPCFILVLSALFWRLFTRKMIKSAIVFSFWRRIFFFIFFYFIKIKPWHKHAKWPPSDLTPWTLTLMPGIKLSRIALSLVAPYLMIILQSRWLWKLRKKLW